MHHLQRVHGRAIWLGLGGMGANGDASPVVHDGHRIVGVERDLDQIAKARQGLVDAVVDHLVDQVVQAADVGRSDIHAGPATDRLQALQDLDIGNFIAGRCVILCHSANLRGQTGFAVAVHVGSGFEPASHEQIWVCSPRSPYPGQSRGFSNRRLHTIPFKPSSTNYSTAGAACQNRGSGLELLFRCRRQRFPAQRRPPHRARGVPESE